MEIVYDKVSPRVNAPAEDNVEAFVCLVALLCLHVAWPEKKKKGKEKKKEKKKDVLRTFAASSKVLHTAHLHLTQEEICPA